MDLHTWLAFVAATCVIAISPGSGAVLAMSHGLSYGVRRTSVTILGLQLGLLLLLLVAGAGVGSLLLASETAFNTVKVLGACYLIYVGWSQWRAGTGDALQGGVTAPAGTWQPDGDARLRTGGQQPAPHDAKPACHAQPEPCIRRRTDGSRCRPVFCEAGRGACLILL